MYLCNYLVHIPYSSLFEKFFAFGESFALPSLEANLNDVVSSAGCFDHCKAFRYIIGKWFLAVNIQYVFDYVFRNASNRKPIASYT